MSIGFIGTGAITEAVVSGLYTRGAYTDRILLSRRTRERSTILAERFPQIEVISENQTLVDRCSDVFVAVLPEQASDLLDGLNFSESHRVISLVAGLSVDAIKPLIAPATQCFRAIPMPPIEFGFGPVPVFPPDEQLQALFASVGDAIPVEDEARFNAFASAGAFMATYFDFVATLAAWMEEEGVEADTAAKFSSSMVHALSKLTKRVDAEKLQKMSEACLTPGGLNEQILHALQEEGFSDSIRDQLDKIMMRLS
ncbi:MAG: NAD(P)-binding domain-containing protein [Pseudomonadota bacterium]